MAQHVYFECHCNVTGCQFCDGGLALCTICNGFEGTLTVTDCPGRKITQAEQDKIYKEGWDFKDGQWAAPLRKKWQS